MARLLDSIDRPQDLHALGDDELVQVAQEVREHIIDTVGEIGGHFGANLGTCELAVALHVLYSADGTGKKLRIYPEVRVVIPLGETWMPALSASLDVSGATPDADGLLPLAVSAPYIELAGVDGVEVPLTLHLPVPSGDRFRVRVLEEGYDVAEPADLTVFATAVPPLALICSSSLGSSVRWTLRS